MTYTHIFIGGLHRPPDDPATPSDSGPPIYGFEEPETPGDRRGASG